MFLLNQLAGRFRLSKGSGKIIIIASVLTYFGGITVPAYAAAKEGVGHLTRALSNEWADHGVNVNAIAPG
jgi:2-deoxy-D-gluconate 3-dehydrogenase